MGEHVVTEEEFALLTARRRQAIATGRIERKVDAVIKRQDAMHLNGDIVALREMAAFWRESGPQLKQLVQVAPIIIGAVEHDRDTAAFWRVTRRFLNPLRPIGAGVWFVVASLIVAYLAAGHPFH